MALNFVWRTICLLVLAGIIGLPALAMGGRARTTAYIHDYIQAEPSTATERKNEIPPACTSEIYTLSIEGADGIKPVHVYTSTNDIVWNGGDICLAGTSCSSEDEPQALANMMTQSNNWASFDYSDGFATLTVTTQCGGLTRENIEDPPGQPTINRNAIVHPNASPLWELEYIDANTFRINLYQPTENHWPKQFYLKLPGACHSEHPLFIFANPQPADGDIDLDHPGCPADDNDPEYTIIGIPGRQTHIDPGGRLDSINNSNDDLELTLDNSFNGHTFCIPGGAHVKGRIFINGAVNVTINGRGILSGEAFRHFDSGQWNGSQLIFATPADHGDPNNNGKNLTVRGITLTDASRSNIDSAKNMTAENIKLLSWHVNTDGISGAGGTIIKDVFFKVNDDAIKFTHSNCQVNNVVAWQQVAGSIVQMSWNQYVPSQNSHLEKLILIGADRGMSIGTHNLNASLFSVRNMMAGGIKNFTFTNVNAEVPPYSLFSIQLEDDLTYVDSQRQHQCMGPGGALYRCDDLDGNGRIEDLIFTNITISGSPPRMSVIDNNFNRDFDFNTDKYSGNDPFYDLPDTIENITLTNVVVNGKVWVDHVESEHEVHWREHIEFPSGEISGFKAQSNPRPHSPTNFKVW